MASTRTKSVALGAAVLVAATALVPAPALAHDWRRDHHRYERVAPHPVPARRHDGGALALGIVGGLALGAIAGAAIASPGPVRVAPSVGVHVGARFAPVCETVLTRGYDRWGNRVIFRERVCW
ncbi:hypothetical protein [Salinarimonas sp.]|uniref:hypothetical protein n=1 Tax=Salinarimonas sp. TaxID=2766526 RepID=UPI00391D3D9A